MHRGLDCLGAISVFAFVPSSHDGGWLLCLCFCAVFSSSSSCSTFVLFVRSFVLSFFLSFFLSVGTSFSSPIMAGAIASLWQSRPEATNAQIMQIVRASAHLFDNPTDLMGYGIPNFEIVYNALQILGAQAQFLDIQFAMYPNPARDIFFCITYWGSSLKSSV